MPGVTCHQADISDLEAILPAFEGVDTVVHMAANIRGGWEEMLHHNIIGTYNVFEASHRAGAKRVISASSGAVVAEYEQVMPYRALLAGAYEEAPETWEKFTRETPLWPRKIYGCTKVWGEALARHYSDSTDL